MILCDQEQVSNLSLVCLQSRDTLAAMERKQKFDFDRMLYVVDNAQRPHFDHLKAILNQLELDWSR